MTAISRLCMLLLLPALTLGCSNDYSSKNSKSHESKGESNRPVQSPVSVKQPISGTTTAISETRDAVSTTDDEGEWGSLKGQIIVEGDVPEPDELKVDKDASFCLRDGRKLLDQSLLVGAEGGLSNAYVMIYLRSLDEPLKVHPSYEDSMKQPVVLDNKNCQFEPLCCAVRKNQKVIFKNSDEVGHNVRVTGEDPKNKSVPANDQVEVTFEEVDDLPAGVECNIHPFMKGVLIVREDPYVAISNEKGEFELKNLPAGKWSFQFWHFRSGYLRELTRDGEKFLGKRGNVEFEIKAGETLDLGKLVISAEVFE